MSAYMVNGSTINKVIAVITHNDMGWTEEDKIKLGEQLISMNADAVGSRYGTGVAFPEFSFENLMIDEIAYESGDPGVLCPFVKAMNCFLYQCCEGDVPGTKLYKRCELAKNDMVEMIVMNMPEYESAPWG